MKDVSDSATGRRLTNVDITPEMIAAGARALATFDPEFSTLRDGARSVLSAALSVDGLKVDFGAAD